VGDPRCVCICSSPPGDARYFGGEEALVDLVHEAASGSPPPSSASPTGCSPRVAARHGVVVPAGGRRRLAPLPVGILGQSDLAELLGPPRRSAPWAEFAALPDADILVRFGADGPRDTGGAGRSGELPDLRQPRIARLLDTERLPDTRRVTEPGFWVASSDTDARRPGAWWSPRTPRPDGVVTAHLQGGAAPAEQSRSVTEYGGRPEGRPRPAPCPRGPDGIPPCPGRGPLRPGAGADLATPGGSRCASRPAAC